MIIESHLVNEKLYVSTKFLCGYFNRTSKQIGRWVKQGLPVATKPKEINERGNYFILEEAIEWTDKNINKAKASNSKGNVLEENQDDKLADTFEIYKNGNASAKGRLLLTLDQNTLDKFKKIEDIIEKESKNKEYDTRYVLVDNVKKGQQELASLFISTLKNSMPVLSKSLESKEQNEIYDIMDKHFSKEMQKIVKYIRKHENIIVTLDQIINFIVYLINEKQISHENILLKLDELNTKDENENTNTATNTNTSK